MTRRVLDWDPDEDAIRNLGRHPEVAAAIADIGAQVKQEVERIAPRGLTEQYAESIVIGEVGEREGTIGIDVGSTDFAAHIVEFGSANNPPYRPFHRGAQALGLRVED